MVSRVIAFLAVITGSVLLARPDEPSERTHAARCRRRSVQLDSRMLFRSCSKAAFTPAWGPPASEHKTHRLVPEICGGIEHAWAAAVDDGDPVFAPYSAAAWETLPYSRAAMHPHLLDAQLGALPHGVPG